MTKDTRPIMVDRDADLRIEMRTYLDTLTITGDNIGDIRRSLFMPFNSSWNGWVRDDTAERERPAAPTAPQPPAGEAPHRWTATWNSKFGSKIWFDGRPMFAVIAGAEDCRVSEADPVPQWQKCVDAVIEGMNQPKQRALADRANSGRATRS